MQPKSIAIFYLLHPIPSQQVTPSPTHISFTSLLNGAHIIGTDGVLLELISSLAATDKAIRARKFELIRARTEAKRLADVAAKGSKVSHRESRS